jgi:hypothetical protein
MKEKVASFLVPLLIAVVLLYQVLASLRIAVTHGATLLIIGITLAIAVAAGLLAAFGPPLVRVAVLAASTLVFLDVTFHLSSVFDRLRPKIRKQTTNDERRIADLHRIKSALDQYVTEYGALPAPAEYGEGTGPAGFWENWWDLSAHDGNKDGVPFLGFLAEAGTLPSVPLDPVNEPSPKGEPQGGKQYVYLLVPAGYDYAGGASDAAPNRFHYVLGITDLSLETSRPPKVFAGSGCASLWRNQPNFFQNHFDYVLCGTYEATPAIVAKAAGARAKLASEARAKRAAEVRAKRDAVALAKQAEAGRVHLPQDRRRVADLLKIRQGLQKYLATVGPLPAPSDYGEAEPSRGPLFWQYHWDVSSDDGDRDGKAFLDFLVESGTMPSVPVDPDNVAPRDGDPRGGKQYVYLLVPPANPYEGGSCVSRNHEWVYMLGITDLESEVTRPPASISGSGCTCLWRNQPDFFQKQFDYVICGTFKATPEDLARAAAERAKQAAAALAAKQVAEQAAKQAAAGRIHLPQDQRRVADLLRIRQGLQKYLATVGPLPSPAQYGEAEPSKSPSFWQHHWDVSSDDGDSDGKAFLDFLVDSGTMPSVPVDPDNEAPADGDPRGGKQYVYFLASPDNPYGGGSCVSPGQGVYLLGITDLESEAVRPPANIPGSGCQCLWRDQLNFFQQHFDYVICGTFSR